MPITRSQVKKFKVAVIEEFIDTMVAHTDFEDLIKVGSSNPEYIKTHYINCLRNNLLGEKNKTFYIDENEYKMNECHFNGRFHFSINECIPNGVWAHGVLSNDDNEEDYYINSNLNIDYFAI